MKNIALKKIMEKVIQQIRKIRENQTLFACPATIFYDGSSWFQECKRKYSLIRTIAFFTEVGTFRPLAGLQ